MIKLFYTGSASFNTSQSLASKSLGGYISNTTVPNGVLNSIFSPISMMEIYKNKTTIEYISLGMYLFFFEGEKDYDKIIPQFTLKFNPEDNENPEIAAIIKDVVNYEIALAPISGDNVNGFYMESIKTGARPYYLLQDFKKLEWDQQIEFDEVELKEKGVGLWFCRKINSKLLEEKFNFNSDYWNNHEALPDIDFNFRFELGFTYKINLSYVSEHGECPANKKEVNTYTLTEEDLPELSEEGFEFLGWDKQVGDICEEDTVITANWQPIEIEENQEETIVE